MLVCAKSTRSVNISTSNETPYHLTITITTNNSFNQKEISTSSPVLSCAVPALSLNICWNNVFCKLLNYNNWEPVKVVLLSLGQLNYIMSHTKLCVEKLVSTDVCSRLKITYCLLLFNHLCCDVVRKWLGQ